MSIRVSHFVTETLTPSDKAFGLPRWKRKGNAWEVVDSMGVSCKITEDAHGVFSLSRFERGQWITVSKDRNPQRLLDCLA
jgi:hypothetical protein